MRTSCGRLLERWLVVGLGVAGCGGDGGSVDGAAGSDIGLDESEGEAPSGHGRCDGEPGASGIGDPYYPGSGNGGYDVETYHLRVTYDPASDELVGEATITARAKQDLSRFNLDLDGLTVDTAKVDGRGATWSRDGGELSITPARCIRKRARFRSVVRYHGIPEPVTTGPPGGGGFLHTDDGALVVGEPQVAAKWFPVNDHPRDAASFTLDITGPEDLDVVAVGRLVDKHTRDGLTTWRWRAREPMAPYLVGWTMGHYTVDEYRDQGLLFVDAIDDDLLVPPVTPRTGENVAATGRADLLWTRITRTIAVPATGGELSFHVDRETEPDFDFFFVEAHVVGSDAWTTLPDVDGFARQSVPGFCSLPSVHPFALNYLTFDEDAPELCLPTGLTGEWWAASGTSDGWEQWRIDLLPLRRAGGGDLALVRQRPGPAVRRRGSRRHRVRDRRRDDVVRGWRYRRMAGAGRSSRRDDQRERLVRGRPRQPSPRGGRRGARDAGAAGRGHRVRGGPVRRLPVPGRRRDHPRQPADRLRAREPDPADLPVPLLQL